MARIERFEDLIAWQKARSLTSSIYALTRTPGFAKDQNLARQMQRAAVSVMSNIAEGYDRDTPGDFHRFLSMAKGSCGEVICQLYVALDNDYLGSDSFNLLREQAKEVGRIIAGLRRSVARKRQSGGNIK